MQWLSAKSGIGIWFAAYFDNSQLFDFSAITLDAQAHFAKKLLRTMSQIAVRPLLHATGCSAGFVEELPAAVLRKVHDAGIMATSWQKPETACLFASV